MSYIIVSHYGTNKMHIIGAEKDLAKCIEWAQFIPYFDEQDFTTRMDNTRIHEFCPFHLGNIYGVVEATDLTPH